MKFIEINKPGLSFHELSRQRSEHGSLSCILSFSQTSSAAWGLVCFCFPPIIFSSLLSFLSRSGWKINLIPVEYYRLLPDGTRGARLSPPGIVPLINSRPYFTSAMHQSLSISPWRRFLRTWNVCRTPLPLFSSSGKRRRNIRRRSRGLFVPRSCCSGPVCFELFRVSYSVLVSIWNPEIIPKTVERFLNRFELKSETKHRKIQLLVLLIICVVD